MKRTRSNVAREELFHAVERGSRSDVEALLDHGADIHDHCREFPYGTVMHVAAYYGHQHLLPFFLSKGLDVNATDEKIGHTPLHLASNKGHAEVVQFLLDQNANMHALNLLDKKPIHMAIEAGQKDALEIFLKKGVDVEETDEGGSTLLHLSCLSRNVKVVQLLVELKADIHARDSSGQKPIHAAATWGDKNVVEYFLDMGMSIDERDRHGLTILHLAASRGHLEVVQFLVARIATIHAASSVMAEIGANPQLDVQDSDGRTPLHMCHNEPNILNCLLDAGARSDIKDRDGRTVLFYFMYSCIRHNHYDPSVLEKIHPNFVDIDDQTKMTAAHFVVKDTYKIKLFLDLTKLILHYQNDLNVEDEHRKTPMNYLLRNVYKSAIDRYETLIKFIRMFVAHGAYFDLEDCKQIVQNRTLKKTLFADKKFCSDYIVNKFNNIDLPKLEKLPSAISLPVLEKLKLKSNQISSIELAVEEEIRNKGHCDVSRMAQPLLSLLAIKSYILHYRS